MTSARPEKTNATAPVVSIVVRTKDRPQMLARAIGGIAEQTLCDYEIIVVNDGGDPALVASALKQAPAGSVVRIDHLHPQGRWPSANAGVMAARGEFVVLHDDDDLWHPDFLARTVAFLGEHAQAAAVVVPTEIVYEEYADGSWVRSGTRSWSPPGDVVTLFDLIRHNRVVPISMLIRRRVFDEIGLYDSSLEVVGDWEFNLRLASRDTIAYLDGPVLAYWHQRPQQSGPLGNSVNAEHSAHVKFDRIVRDRALKGDVWTAQIADLLYIAKMVDERVGDAERHLGHRLDRIEQLLAENTAGVRHYSLGETVQRLRRRLRARLPW